MAHPERGAAQTLEQLVAWRPRRAGQGNSTLEGRIRHKRARGETLARLTNQLREEAALLARSGLPIPATLSAELRRLCACQLRAGRGLGELRQLLWELTGSAYLPEEGPTPLQFTFTPPGGTDGRSTEEEGRADRGRHEEKVACA